MTNNKLLATINYLLKPLEIKAVFNHQWIEDSIPWKLVSIVTSDTIDIVPISDSTTHSKSLDSILHDILRNIEEFHSWKPTSIYVKNPYLGSACLEEALIRRDLIGE